MVTLRSFRLPAVTVLSAMFLTLSAKGEEWTKRWQVPNQPRVRVETDDASIEVEGSKRDSIEAKVTADGIRIGPGGLEVYEYQRGEYLELRVHLPHNFMSWHSRNVHVSLLVPAQLNLDIKSGDGSLNVNRVEGIIRANTGDGSIQARDISGSLEAVTGDGSLDIAGTFGTLRLRTGDGSINCRVQDASRMKADWNIGTGDGSVDLELPRKLSADLLLTTGDGAIRNGFSEDHDHHDEHRVSDKINGGGPLISVRTGDGSIHVRPN